MSWTPAGDPVCTRGGPHRAVEMIIEPRTRDLGGFSVRRILPSIERQMVGSFIFFDHLGPADFPPGHGIDVRPHPHIGLSTVTYLFAGELVHRDSLGFEQAIRPGAINWMTAGRGIVHSERTGAETRKGASRIHGIQLWVALPKAHEETAPAFHHHAGDTLPVVEERGVRLRVLLGSAYGACSPLSTFSPLFYVDAALPAGGELRLPAEHAERALYVVEGEVACGGDRFAASRMVVFAPGGDAVLRAERSARLVLLGGAPLDGPRHVWWNLVSSSRERIERAKRDWQEGRFPKVPGDDKEFIPLPEG